MTTPTSQPLDTRRLWLVTVVSIVAIVAGQRHRSADRTTPVRRSVSRLVAAAVVTLFVIVAKVVAGPRGAAVTGVVGVLIAVLLLDQVS